MKQSALLQLSAYACLFIAACNEASSGSNGPNDIGGSSSSSNGGSASSSTASAAGNPTTSGEVGGAAPGTGGHSNALALAGGSAPRGQGGASNPGGAGASGTSKATGGASAKTSTGGTASSNASGGNGYSTAGGTTANDTGGTTPVGPFEAVSTAASCRKVKNLLVGLACTDADLAKINDQGVAGLKSLIATWMTDDQYKTYFEGKMLGFFRNAFQQSGFVPTEDFKPQLLENGGFDFGPIGYRGDDAFARIVQNLQDSFALTAWQTVAEGRPFTDVLSTKRFMLTTALKSLYLQIEMPNDQPYSFAVPSAQQLKWKVEYGTRDIPLSDTLDPNSPDYLVFSDLPPSANATSFLQPTCQNDGQQRQFSGYAQLFQRLLGFTPRYPFAASPQCWEHGSKPYYTTSDLTDWQWVTIRPLASGEKLIQPFDLPTLRTTTTLPLNLPRVGFFTTPAFLALWQTNNSNQHRVTANQALIVATGQTFTPDNLVIPVSNAGIDANHTTTSGTCYGCHKNLDPLRQFWATQYDFNDRNDFLTNNFFGGVANPRPTTTGGTLAWGDVNQNGSSLSDLASLIAQVNDTSDPNETISRFALSMAQKLCFYANSGQCEESDPEYRRVAKAFASSGYDFGTLVSELFSSPLVTTASDTATFDADGVIVSVSRRDHLCASLSNRLGLSDVCSLAVPQPSSSQLTTFKIAGSVAADAVSRGSTIPVTPAKMTLFYRAGTEMLCENVAALVVDASSGGVYQSSSATSAIDAMVQNIMGYPTSDSHYTSAVDILTRHYNDAQKAPNSASKTNALRSTFALACQSPTSLGIGM